ncbi:MAG: ral secretory system protein E-like protein [Polaromonas sp.]|nr:ral secretory system protein E-like protein [Polaromonas sp.]
MWLVDVIALYLYGLKYLAVALAAVILVSGLDDLFIDIAYWSRRLWRGLTVYSRHKKFDPQCLQQLDEKPLAIMVPAWQEHGVIGNMAELAATTLHYENYHIFVGTYPNDAQTQREVEQVQARFPNVHKVVCVRPGPTSKADCLNNVLDAIFQFEQRAGLTFEGFVLHDSEDVLSKSELRVFNLLVDRKDLIQVPVYPLPRKWHEFTGGHYLDEFAEMHGKDVVVREALAGQVPSAGVGTCFSRRAIKVLLQEGNGIAFDVQSLTEDYDIGFRLKARGMQEVFVRIPADAPTDRVRPRWMGRGLNTASTVAVREYFPDTISTAVRQKSRWIIGIVFQGFRTHRWTSSRMMNYFLWRDRKGLVTNFASFLAMLLALQLMVIWAYGMFMPDSYKFLSIFEDDALLFGLLAVNFVLMANRVAQRMIFVTGYYGVGEGLLCLPRLLWGNLINFMANWRAVKQVLSAGDSRRVAWDKTCHQFPTLGAQGRARKPLGEILVEQGGLSQAQLAEEVQTAVRGLRLGSRLVHKGHITAEQLAMALAEQGQVPWERMNSLTLAPTLLAQVSAGIALHYAVLPLREEGPELVLASESAIDPVSLAAIGRKLSRPVRYVIVPKGQVVVGLRYWYARHRQPSASALLDKVFSEGDLTIAEAEVLWQEYVSLQVLMGEVLLAMGRIDAAALSAVLLRHERSGLSIGQFLVSEGVITEAVLDEVLQLQEQHQTSMATLLRRAGQAIVPESDSKKVYLA